MFFKAFVARATAVYLGVNEDCEGKYNVENTLLDNFSYLTAIGLCNLLFGVFSTLSIASQTIGSITVR